MAEWLGKGLQNLLQRFDSASHLKNNKVGFLPTFIIFEMRLIRIYTHIPPQTPPLRKEGLIIWGNRSVSAEPLFFEMRDYFASTPTFLPKPLF